MRIAGIYEPDELPGCSTPHNHCSERAEFRQTAPKTFRPRKVEPVSVYRRLHHTSVTPIVTTAMPIQRCRLIRSPRNNFAPKAPAA